MNVFAVFVLSVYGSMRRRLLTETLLTFNGGGFTIRYSETLFYILFPVGQGVYRILNHFKLSSGPVEK